MIYNMHKAMLILLIFLLMCSCSSLHLKKGQRLDDPLGKYVAKKSYNLPGNVVLVKYVSDFNNDGLEDMAVSDSRAVKKNLNKWILFTANDDLSYTVAGKIYFNPQYVKIKPVGLGKTIIQVYGKKNEKQGYIYEYAVSGRGIKKISKSTIESSKIPYGLKNSPKRAYVCDLISFLKSRNCLWKKSYNMEVN